jgi:biopolymer transport protein ExbD
MGFKTAGSPEINVTPLIDVLLVLLIIFLVMIPAVLRVEPVALPPATGEISGDKIVAVKLAADLSVALDDGPVFPNRELATQLRAKLPNTRAVFVDASDAVPWGEVIATVDTVRGVAADVSPGELSVAVRLHDVE